MLRRQRRDRGLARPQRVAEHLVGRDLGLGASRRRRRHRLLAARRHGRRGRRHPRGGRETAARADVRSRHRRRAPRRRRVSGGDRHGASDTASTCRHFRFTGDRGDDDSGASVARAARPRGARRIGRRRPAHSGRPRRLRHGPHVAAAAPARSHRPHAVAVHRRRAHRDDAGAVPRRRCARRRRSRASVRPARRRPEPGAREAFDASLAFLDTARAAGDAPATFLLDEFLELRTFESFPGLRSVLRDLVGALASSGNRFVLTTPLRRARAPAAARRAGAVRDHPRRAAHARRDPRDAAAHARTPRSAPGSLDDEDDRARDELARLVHALSDGRPSYARADRRSVGRAWRRAAAPIRSAR